VGLGEGLFWERLLRLERQLQAELWGRCGKALGS
jgi:hypothetical protein